MQFKNLEAKFGLVLECKVTNYKIKETELEQVYFLLDWLNFVGCKIPAVLYTIDRLERNLRMKIATCYIFLKFISQRDDLNVFLNEHINKSEEDEKKKKEDINHIISFGDKFMIYPSQSPRILSKKTYIKNISVSNSIGNKSNLDDEAHLNLTKNNFVKQLTKKGTLESINKSTGNANNNNNNSNNNSNGSNGTIPKQNNYFQQKSMNFNKKDKESFLHLNQSISEEKVDDSESGNRTGKSIST